MDQDFMKWLSGLGVGGILAAIFYYQNNKNTLECATKITEVTKKYSDKLEELLNVEKGRTEILVTLVKDNSTQTTANTEVLRALHRRLDREEYKEKNGDSTRT
jgi:hypothetical protein